MYTIDISNLDELPGIMLNERTESQRYILCDSICRTFSQIYGGGEQTYGCQGLGEGIVEGSFGDDKTVLTKLCVLNVIEQYAKRSNFTK